MVSARQSVCRLGCPLDSQCANSDFRQTVSVPTRMSVRQTVSVPTRMSARQSVCRLGFYVGRQTVSVPTRMSVRQTVSVPTRMSARQCADVGYPPDTAVSVPTRMYARQSVCRRLGCPPDSQCADSDSMSARHSVRRFGYHDHDHVRQTVSVLTRISSSQSVCRVTAESDIRQTISMPTRMHQGRCCLVPEFEMSCALAAHSGSN